MSAIGDLHKRLPQGDVWIDAHGRGLRVASMNRRHAANAVAFLERNAEYLHDAECYKLMMLPLPHGDSAQDAFDDEANRLFETKPLDWLNEQPLMIALRERAGDHPGGASLGWRLRHFFPRPQAAAAHTSEDHAFEAAMNGEMSFTDESDDPTREDHP